MDLQAVGKKVWARVRRVEAALAARVAPPLHAVEARLDLWLGLGPDTPTDTLLRTRVNSVAALSFAAFQICNQIVMLVEYGRFTVQHAVSAVALVAMLAIANIPRHTRSPWVLGGAWMAVTLGCIALSVSRSHVPVVLGGVGSSLVPLLCVSAMIVALVGKWRLGVAYWVLASLMLVWMHGMSVDGAARLGADTARIIVTPGADMALGAALELSATQRFSQALIALGVVAVTGSVFSHLLYSTVALRDAALAEARRQQRAKGDVLALMSHEIRTPMSGVVGVAELLARHPDLNPQARQEVEVLGAASKQLMGVLDTALDHARLEAGALELAREAFDLRAELERLIRLQAARAHAKGIWIGLHWPKWLPHHVMGDAARIGQVVGNLLGNAVKFTDHGGVRIVVEGDVVRSRMRLRLHVQDTGAGIAPEDQGRVFDRYAQSARGRRQGSGGTGLGLAIARELTELMGGTLRLQSQPGRGSTFTLDLDLPLADAPVEDAPVEDAPVEDAPVEDASTAGAFSPAPQTRRAA